MTHRHALLLLAVVLLAYFGPPLLRGEVIFAHDNRVEMGLPAIPDGDRISSRKLSDQSSVYIPSLQIQLGGEHEGWISTWNPHPELGRPTYHVSGFSKAFLLTHLYSWFSDDAFVVYTWLAISAVSLSTFFGYGLLRSLRLHPAACAAGALWLGMGITVVFWLTFVMLIWGICWTLALLWGVTVFLRRPGWPCWLGISFSVHALFMTGYPQHIVWQGYLLSGYVAFGLIRQRRGLRESGVVLAGLAAAVFIGLVSIAPVYLDLLLTTQRSARFDADPGFFAKTLPKIGGVGDLAFYFMRLFDPFWLGNPIRDRYPGGFDGVCLSPLVASLGLLSLAGGMLRRLWPAQAFAAFTLLMTLSPPLYMFGVAYGGLRVSRFDPLAASLIPAAVLAAIAADHVIRTGVAWKPSLALVTAPALVAAIGAASSSQHLEPAMIAMGLSLVAGSVAFVRFRSPVLLVALSVIGAFHYGLPMQLVRRHDEIQLRSRLVDLVHRETGGLERFALVGENLKPIIPPNQEVIHGLRSIHTYNSLSANIYQSWTSRISERGTVALGRHFRSISAESRLGVPELSYAGVGLWISALPLDAEVAGERLIPVGAGGVYRARRQPLREAQVSEFRTFGDHSASIAGHLHAADRLPVERVLDRDDHLRFVLSTSSEETLLFVSQQYHPQWRASAGGTELATTLVGGFFQGVRVPPGTREIDLRFLPAVRWSWLAQVFFVVAAAVVWARPALSTLRPHDR